MTKSDLPFGSEFSPSQISLPRVLALAKEHGGSWKSFELAICREYFADYKTSDKNKGKLANNTKLGMIAYGLIDRDANLTECGEQLYRLRTDDAALYAALAKHVLLHRHGMALVQCVQDMMAAGERVTLDTLRGALAARGIHYPAGGKHPSMMRLWLEKAGVIFPDSWRVNEQRLREVTGVDVDEYGVLAKLSVEQRAFVRALVNTGIRTPQPANEIVKLASAVYGVRFPEKSLPKAVLQALLEAGYITAEKTTTGRGAKPFLVAPTDKLVADVVEPLLEQLAKQTDASLLHLLRKSLRDILIDLESTDRHVAGLALEALAFKLMRLVDMEYVATRLRGAATGGAEVDVIFQAARLVYSRWQVQCKNTARVSLDDVAKEVGLTHFLKSTVIVVVTTGDVGGEARRYANKIMAESNLAIVMLNGRDLREITTRPSVIVDVFQREARHAMKLKALAPAGIHYDEG